MAKQQIYSDYNVSSQPSFKWEGKNVTNRHNKIASFKSVTPEQEVDFHWNAFSCTQVIPNTNFIQLFWQLRMGKRENLMVSFLFENLDITDLHWLIAETI